MTENYDQLLERLAAGQSAHLIARAAVGMTDESIITQLRWEDRSGKLLKHPLVEVAELPTSIELTSWEDANCSVVRLPDEVFPVVVGAILLERTRTAWLAVERSVLMNIVQDNSGIMTIIKPHLREQSERVAETTARVERLEQIFATHNGRIDVGPYHLDVHWANLDDQDNLSILCALEGVPTDSRGYLSAAEEGYYGPLSQRYAHLRKYPGVLPIPTSDILADSSEWEEHLEEVENLLHDPLKAMARIGTVAEQLEVLGASSFPNLAELVESKKWIEAQVGQLLPVKVSPVEVLVWMWANCDNTDLITGVFQRCPRELKLRAMRAGGDLQKKMFYCMQVKTAVQSSPFTLSV